MTQHANILIAGASLSGMAVAACLQHKGLAYTIIEKESQIATPWRRHYERLHLHTNKRISGLPFKKFDRRVPVYPSREEVLSYLEDYQAFFDIRPQFDTAAVAIRKTGGVWEVETNKGRYTAACVVMATGAFSKPRQVSFTGMQSFPGRILHSSEYKSGRDFKGERVLVVGFGNSACEIAIDLVEQGANTCMSVRSPVNVIPRDLAGIPILEFSLLMSRLPTGLADRLNKILMRLTFPDITRLGLQQMPYGPFTQIKNDHRAPVLDIGVIKHISKNNIKICSGIQCIEGQSVQFSDGSSHVFDSIIACIGFDNTNIEILQAGRERFDDLHSPSRRQQYFGKDGLYFCGFRISPTGHIREISRDAARIAKHIAEKDHH